MKLGRSPRAPLRQTLPLVIALAIGGGWSAWGAPPACLGDLIQILEKQHGALPLHAIQANQDFPRGSEIDVDIRLSDGRVIKKLMKNELIASGGFGEVFKLTATFEDGSLGAFAWKQGKRDPIDRTEPAIQRLLSLALKGKSRKGLISPIHAEIEILTPKGPLKGVLTDLNGPNIFRDLSASVGKRPLAVSTAASTGNMEQVQKAVLGLGLLFKDISTAVAQLHRAGVIHRDIKHANILYQDSSQLDGVLGDGKRFVLSDFGGAQAKGQTGRVTGTKGFRPEEVLTAGASAQPSDDTFGIGRVLLEGLTGKRNDREGEQNIAMHASQALDSVALSVEGASPTTFQLYKALASVARHTTILDPAQRAQALASNPWIRVDAEGNLKGPSALYLRLLRKAHREFLASP